MSQATTNSLEKASSAYLRSAMHQPVNWYAWGPEPFERAAAENKPVLLDIGAVWCHWCHVMDRESYENPETARIINENFIAVKVDRDERPDVDTRYQAAVQAISGQGGWPLTGFLTPDGKPFFGGTYFPPDDRYGRPGFPRVLLTMANAFQTKREDVDESAGSIMSAIEYNETFNGASSDLLQNNAASALLDKLLTAILAQFDPKNGGFGAQPKFPHPAALDLLIDAASRPGPVMEQAQTAAIVTLKKMAAGGIHDQLAGGFHRYSVDEHWIVPHFEKMAYDNSELLRSYVHAFQTFVDPECADTASGILRWMQDVLSDREQGGFFASQDADLSLDDDGDYFTWTRAEAAQVLSEEELAVAELYYDIGTVGDMHHDPARNVLHRPLSFEEVAKRTGIAEDRVRDLVATGRGKLYATRMNRPTPYVDKTLYTGWNAMCISAYLNAGRVLGRQAAVAFGLKSLDRVLRSALKDGVVSHVVAYADESVPANPVPGVLDDYVFLGHACLDAWELTGEIAFYDAGEEIAATLLSRFYDGRNAGFFDTDSQASERIGALSTRRKPLQDAPTPAGNPSAVSLLLRLHALSGREAFRECAEDTLESFAGIVEHFGLYASSFGLALSRLFRPAVQVVVVGEGASAAQLETMALARYAVNKTVIRLRRSQLGSLPPALAETLPNLPESEKALALVCAGTTCYPPVTEPEDLIRILNSVL